MTAPPCAGQWALFDSTDFYDHRRARQLCAECPMIAACRQALADVTATARAVGSGGGPRGTWAGQLAGGHSPNFARIATEEEMFTTDEARKAHAVWTRTANTERRDLPDRIALGERVYQRRSKRGELAAARLGVTVGAIERAECRARGRVA